MEQWKGGSRWCQAHTALWVDLLHWGPDERFPSFAEETNKAIFRCLPRPWNKAEKIAVVNSFSSMWLEINSALAAEGQRPSQWQAQPEASTKKDKRDLWPSAMSAVAPFFLHWKIGLSTHTPKAGVTLGDLQMLQKRLVVFRFTVPVENPDIGIPAKGNRRCLRFQTPDLQSQIQDEDLTYV